MTYPQATIIGSELGRPDDGTDPTGFFNCEFYMGLKPYGDKSWKTGSIHTKAELTADLDRKLSAYPGVIFNYTQPAEDAVDEALTGLKSSLAVKVFGPDLDVLEQKAVEIKNILAKTPGFTDLTVVRELGQPSLIVDADRDKIARYGINVSDVETVVQAAVGGQAATQVIQGEKLFDLVVRMEPQYRSNATRNRATCLCRRRRANRFRSRARDHQREPAARPSSIAKTIRVTSAFSFRLKGATSKASCARDKPQSAKAVQLPQGYRLDWGGEYSELLAGQVATCA